MRMVISTTTSVQILIAASFFGKEHRFENNNRNETCTRNAAACQY